MKKILYITGSTGSGKTTALRKLAGDTPITLLDSMLPISIKALSGAVYVDNYREAQMDKFQLLLDNEKITSIVVASEQNI